MTFFFFLINNKLFISPFRTPVSTIDPHFLWLYYFLYNFSKPHIYFISCLLRHITKCKLNSCIQLMMIKLWQIFGRKLTTKQIGYKKIGNESVAKNKYVTIRRGIIHRNKIRRRSLSETAKNLSQTTAYVSMWYTAILHSFS